VFSGDLSRDLGKGHPFRYAERCINKVQMDDIEGEAVEELLHSQPL